MLGISSIFSTFSRFSKTTGYRRTDATDGQTLIYRCEDASKKRCKKENGEVEMIRGEGNNKYQEMGREEVDERTQHIFNVVSGN